MIVCSICISGGAQALAQALEANTHVTHLDLSYNVRLQDQGAVSLAGMVKSNSVLTCLYMHGASIGRAGAVALADALEQPLPYPPLPAPFF